VDLPPPGEQLDLFAVEVEVGNATEVETMALF
jgi:hypothetical protein